MKIKFKYNGVDTDGFGDPEMKIPALKNIKYFNQRGKRMVSGVLSLKVGDSIKWPTGGSILVPANGNYSFSFFEEPEDEPPEMVFYKGQL